jgi:hypothetical protein
MVWPLDQDTLNLVIAVVVVLLAVDVLAVHAVVRRVQRRERVCGWAVRDDWGVYVGRCVLPPDHAPQWCSTGSSPQR